MLLIAAAACAVLTAGAAGLTAALTSSPPSYTMSECGGPGIRIPDLNIPNTGLIICDPSIAYAALVYGTDHKWWLIADTRIEPDSLDLASQVQLVANGEQIIALLPSPCSVLAKLSPRTFRKSLNINGGPIEVQPAPGYQIANYLQGGKNPACHLQVARPAGTMDSLVPAGRIHFNCELCPSRGELIRIRIGYIVCNFAQEAHALPVAFRDLPRHRSHFI